MNLLDINSPLNRYLTLAFDVMLLGLLWLFTSVPLVTIGASTTAAYYVMLRRVSEREGSSIIKDYFIAFKRNFKYSTIIFLILAFFFVMNFVNYFFSSYAGTLGMLLNAFHILFAIEIAFVYIHAFPIISRFEMKFLDIVKTSILMAHKHLVTTITHAALVAALYFLVTEVQIVLFFVVFGPYCWLSSMMLTRLYRKYRPEFDKDED